MARCTAPVNGHRSASAAANCPACRGRYGRYGSGGGYNSYSPSTYSSSLTSGGVEAAAAVPSAVQNHAGQE